MGVRRCLARSLTSLALLRTPKSANGPRSNSFRPDSPLHNQLPTGTEDSGGGFRGTGHGPFRPLIVSNLKWGGPCRGHYVFPQTDTKSSAFYKGAMKAYRISRTR